jgi:hypothetical protein
MLQQWSEEPWSEDEDATSVHESREASDEEEADNSEPLVHEASGTGAQDVCAGK